MFCVECVMNTDCNLGCYFCFASNKSNSKFVNIKNLELILENLTKITTEKKILFKYYGGEVLLHQDEFVKHVELIKSYKPKYPELNFEIALITNLTVIPNEKIIKFIKNKDIFYSVSMEINKEYHNKIRHYLNGKGSFNDVISNVKKMYELTNEKVYIQTVMSKEWIFNTEKYLCFMDSYKDICTFGTVPMFGNNEISEDMLKEFPNALNKLLNYIKKEYDTNNDCGFQLFHETRSIMKLLHSNTSGRISNNKHCLAGYEQITLVQDKLCSCSRAYHNNIDFLFYKDLDDYFIARDNLFADLIKFDDECNVCQKVNNIGCIGKCMCTDILNNNEKEKNVCKYNIIFGNYVKQLFKEMKENKKFIDDLFSSLNYNSESKLKFIDNLTEICER